MLDEVTTIRKDERLRTPEVGEVVPGIRDFIQVTERPFQDILKSVGRLGYWWTKKDETIDGDIDKIIDDLPPNARVVDVGSGTFQGMAKFIKARRPDITTFSLDPTLMVDPHRIASGEVIVFRNEDQSGRFVKDRVSYVTLEFLESGIDSYNEGGSLFSDPKSNLLKTFGRQLPPEGALDIHNSRLASASEYGGVPFVYPHFPEQLTNIDWLVECFGPLYYANPNSPEKDDYLHDIINMLKVGGKADIAPWHGYSYQIDPQSLELDNAYVIDEKKFYGQFSDPSAEVEMVPLSYTGGQYFTAGLHVTKTS